MVRAQGGDRPALDALVRRHLDSVYAVAMRVLGDPSAAADAAQDTFVRAMAGLDGFRADASFRTWLLRIAANTARSAGRRSTSRREVAIEPATGMASGERDPASEAISRTEADRAERALAELPEKQRLAVTLRINEGLSHREIGEITGSTEGAARVNYHLGIKRLREMMS